jgi:hypothetical protein
LYASARAREMPLPAINREDNFRMCKDIKKNKRELPSDASTE